MVEPYDVLLCDAPWPYRNKKTGGSMKSGVAAKYNTMTIDKIADLADLVKAVSHDSTVCFFWTTTPMKDVALPILECWGFNYKTTVYWHKVGRLGMGFWFRGEMEELLVGAGRDTKAFRCQERNVIPHKTLGHSRKPEVFVELIERATPGARRLEMFATREREGWDCIGHELDGLDIRESLGRLAPQGSLS